MGFPKSFLVIWVLCNRLFMYDDHNVCVFDSSTARCLMEFLHSSGPACFLQYEILFHVSTCTCFWPASNIQKHGQAQPKLLPISQKFLWSNPFPGAGDPCRLDVFHAIGLWAIGSRGAVQWDDGGYDRWNGGLGCVEEYLCYMVRSFPIYISTIWSAAKKGPLQPPFKTVAFSLSYKYLLGSFSRAGQTGRLQAQVSNFFGWFNKVVGVNKHDSYNGMLKTCKIISGPIISALVGSHWGVHHFPIASWQG